MNQFAEIFPLNSSIFIFRKYCVEELQVKRGLICIDSEGHYGAKRPNKVNYSKSDKTDFASVKG